MLSDLDLRVESLDQPVVTHEPDTAASVVVCLPAGTAALVGPRLQATYAPGSPITRMRVRLAPGAAPAVPPAGGFVSWGRLWPSGSVSADEVAELVNTLRANGSERADLVQRASALLGHNGVRHTAELLHVSERHLRVVFADVMGLSPKAYARVERVRAALARIGERDFARLADELGYYDQSHLTNEFRSVMGVTPGAYAAGRRLPPTPCTAVQTASGVDGVRRRRLMAYNRKDSNATAEMETGTHQP
jgi:AraC-like DNA-binding protein